MNTDKTIISISISSDLLALIDKAATLEGRTRSNMVTRLIEYALTDHMEENEHD